MNPVFYKPKHFRIEELVDPVVYKRFGQRALMFFDSRLLVTADAVREYFDQPMIINNWKTRGNYSHRGFRRPNCKVGAGFSQHKFGRAIDFDIKGLTAEEVRIEILNNQKHPAFTHITTLERGVSWVHLDIRMQDSDEIILINP